MEQKEVKAIASFYNVWFCKRCKDSDSVLYIDEKDNRYCSKCVPSEVKEKAVYYNQNREKIEYSK